MSPIEQFRTVVSEATASYLPNSSAQEIVPFGAMLIKLIRSNPAMKALFEHEFIEMTSSAPPELIEFCMHALRWGSLRNYFAKQQSLALESNDWRVEPYYRHLLEAFEDEWEDAKYFYSAYFYPTLDRSNDSSCD